MDEGYSWLRLLIDSSFASRLLVDRSANIVFANLAAETLFGYGPDELTGKPIDVLFASPQDRDLAVPRRYFPGRRIRGDHEEIRGCTKQGRELVLRVGTSPIETVAASYVSVTIFDITRYKQTERELLFKGRQLEEAKRRVSKFALLAANDLQERLQRIGACVFEAKSALAAGDMVAAAAANDRVLDSTSNAQRLVDALLEYSLQASAILNLEFIHLRSEVDSVLNKLSETAGDAGPKIENKVPADLRIRADKPMFMRLLRDLVEKSMSLRRNASGIIISATRNKEKNGILLGIGGKEAGRGEENNSFREAGARMRLEEGLAAVRSICEQHGWTVEAGAPPERGGFQVSIPVNDPPLPAP